MIGTGAAPLVLLHSPIGPTTSLIRIPPRRLWRWRHIVATCCLTTNLQQNKVTLTEDIKQSNLNVMANEQIGQADIACDIL